MNKPSTNTLLKIVVSVKAKTTGCYVKKYQASEMIRRKDLPLCLLRNRNISGTGVV